MPSNKPIEILLKNAAQRINISVFDANGDLIDADDGPHLTVMDTGESVLHKDSYPEFTLTGTVSVTASSTTVTGVNTKFTTELKAGDTITIAAEDRSVDSISTDTSLTLTTPHTAGASTVTATKETRIVHQGTGLYYILWGDPAAPANVPDQTETSESGTVLFQWSFTPDTGEENVVFVQVAKIISARMASIIPELKLLVDKAVKRIDEDENDPCFLGYSDWMLVAALNGGLQAINAYQPYPTWASVDAFPIETNGRLLIDAAAIFLLTSQEIFAIDEDLEFQDQGNSFSIQHFPKLAQVIESMQAKLDKAVPAFKMHYVSSGASHIQVGPGMRYQMIFNAAPKGSLFANFFVA